MGMSHMDVEISSGHYMMIGLARLMVHGTNEFVYNMGDVGSGLCRRCSMRCVGYHNV